MCRANDEVFIPYIFCRINGTGNTTTLCWQVTFPHHGCTCFCLISDTSQLNTKQVMLYHEICHNNNTRGGKKLILGCSVFQNPDILPVRGKGEEFFPGRKDWFFALYCRVQLPGSVLAGIWIVQCFGEALAWLLAHPAVLLCWCTWMASRAVSVVVLLAWNWKQPLLTMTVVFFCHF